MTPKFHTLKIENIHLETEDTISVSFAIPEDLKSDYAFKAGQYLTLKAIIDGQDVRRSYSICKSPSENELRVAIKKVENGLFSNWAFESLKEKMDLEVMTPSGHFTFEPNANNSNSYLLIAAGSGITPVISIAKTILLNEPNSFVNLIYGNKGFSSIIFREEIEGLKNKFLDKLRVIHVLSRESLGNQLQKGRIDKEKVTKIHMSLLANENFSAVYICGPESMILSSKEALTECNVDEKNIHFELFGVSPVKKEEKNVENEADNVKSKVTIILDGDHIELDLDSSGKNILDAGFEAGADLPFACKGGVCCTCKARILEGTASMDLNYALEKDEVEAGYILTCQAHPTSEKLVVSFDD